ncbi:MAG: PepSY domain-containing protein [Hyphomicrobiaceae bacterium]
MSGRFVKTDRMTGARTKCLAVLSYLAIALAAVCAPGRADDGDDHERARGLLLNQHILPLEELQSLVLKRFPGRMIGVDLEQKKGRVAYEFKILSENGRVLEVEVDARTGDVLEVEEDD